MSRAQLGSRVSTTPVGPRSSTARRPRRGAPGGLRAQEAPVRDLITDELTKAHAEDLISQGPQGAQGGSRQGDPEAFEPLEAAPAEAAGPAADEFGVRATDVSPTDALPGA